MDCKTSGMSSKTHNFYRRKQFFKHLGIVKRPSVNDVHQNLINISNICLSNFQLFSIYKQDYVSTHGNDRADLVDIIVDVIEYLQEHKAESILQQLHY